MSGISSPMTPAELVAEARARFADHDGSTPTFCSGCVAVALAGLVEQQTAVIDAMRPLLQHHITFEDERLVGFVGVLRLHHDVLRSALAPLDAEPRT